MKFILGFILTTLALNVNALILNNLNGVDYEWLDLSATFRLSRDTVESRISDPNDALYGYQYASRSLFESLLLSYSPWDGKSGFHTTQSVVDGIDAFVSDFRYEAIYNQTNTLTSVEGVVFTYDRFIQSRGYYGSSSECGSNQETCFSIVQIDSFLGAPVAGYQLYTYGWDSSIANPRLTSNQSTGINIGSYLVREIIGVPEPSMIPLLGFGLIVMVSASTRKHRSTGINKGISKPS